VASPPDKPAKQPRGEVSGGPRAGIISAAPLIPEHPTLESLRSAAAACHACPLWEKATRTVFGEGEAGARLVLVGEQPGDEEDLSGRPFVGPAGRLLDRGLAEAGIDRRQVYVTNAVKHFKWTPKGKRRIHERPNAREVAACQPWLLAELAVVRPQVVVCLGATAAQTLFGKSFKVTERRGELVPFPHAPFALATVHPSSILRTRDDEQRHRERLQFFADLALAAPHLA